MSIISRANYKSLIIIICLLLSACNSKKLEQYDYLPDASSVTAKIFIQRCSLCHMPPHPQRHVKADWPKIVKLMEQRMVEYNYPGLELESKKDILHYLIKYAR
jgi:hypothetical protein